MNRATLLYEAIETGPWEAALDHLWCAVGHRARRAEQWAWLNDPQGPAPFEPSYLAENRAVLSEALFHVMGTDQVRLVAPLSALMAHLPGQPEHERDGDPHFYLRYAVQEGSLAVIQARWAWEDPRNLGANYMEAGTLLEAAIPRGKAEIVAWVAPHADEQAHRRAHQLVWKHAHPHLVSVLGPDPLQPADRLLALLDAKLWAAVDAYASTPVCPIAQAQAVVHLWGHRQAWPRLHARLRQHALNERPASTREPLRPRA